MPNKKRIEKKRQESPEKEFVEVERHKLEFICIGTNKIAGAAIRKYIVKHDDPKAIFLASIAGAIQSHRNTNFIQITMDNIEVIDVPEIWKIYARKFLGLHGENKMKAIVIPK